MRVVGWFLVVLLLLLALVVPALLSPGRSADDGLNGFLHRHLMELSGSGGGFRDGFVVFEERAPDRITVEQLPTLEGRLRGIHYGSEALADELIWYGVSLRECIARCLGISPALVLGDASLDGVWLDVNAARSRGLLEAPTEDWSAIEARILEGVAAAYGLDVERERSTRHVAVLRAGPRWAEHERGGRWGGQRVMHAPGQLELENAPTALLLEQIAEVVPCDVLEGIDPRGSCTVALAWDAGNTEAFETALTEQLDLHVVEESREVDMAVVKGVATPPER